jgi:hypothetical protein
VADTFTACFKNTVTLSTSDSYSAMIDTEFLPRYTIARTAVSTTMKNPSKSSRNDSHSSATFNAM